MDVDCIFCKIIAGEFPSDTVLETEHAYAFRDLSPQAPTHVLVIPRRHVANVAELAAASEQETGALFAAAAQVADQEGIAGPDAGYRLVANTGANAQQAVFHAHVHVLGGRSMTWPPG